MWPAGGYGLYGPTAARAESVQPASGKIQVPAPDGSRADQTRSASTGTSSTRAAKLADQRVSRASNEGGTFRTSHQAITEVSSPTRHGVAGGRPQMAYHHINLARR